MRASLRLLATYGVVATAFVMSPVMAQGDKTAPASTSAVVPADEVKKALSEIKTSWQDFRKCERSRVCGAYFESFGVGITFNDGTIVPFSHTQRLTASEHDCIVNARAALNRGDRGLAVQWVMASKLNTSPDVRDWLGDHPDAVVEALRDCCS